jgi:hypothetical protein
MPHDLSNFELCNWFSIFGEQVFISSLNPQAGEPHLVGFSRVKYNKFKAALKAGRLSSVRNLRTHTVVATRNPINLRVAKFHPLTPTRYCTLKTKLPGLRLYDQHT